MQRRVDVVKSSKSLLYDVPFCSTHSERERESSSAFSLCLNLGSAVRRRQPCRVEIRRWKRTKKKDKTKNKDETTVCVTTKTSVEAERSLMTLLQAGAKTQKIYLKIKTRTSIRLVAALPRGRRRQRNAATQKKDRQKKTTTKQKRRRPTASRARRHDAERRRRRRRRRRRAHSAASSSSARRHRPRSTEKPVRRQSHVPPWLGHRLVAAAAGQTRRQRERERERERERTERTGDGYSHHQRSSSGRCDTSRLIVGHFRSSSDRWGVATTRRQIPVENPPTATTTTAAAAPETTGGRRNRQHEISRDATPATKNSTARNDNKKKRTAVRHEKGYDANIFRKGTNKNNNKKH